MEMFSPFLQYTEGARQGILIKGEKVPNDKHQKRL